MSIDPARAVDKSKCAAYGCPCLGTMTNSTVGSEQWLCSFHVRRDAGDWPAVTMELNRLGWLVRIVEGIKAKNLTSLEKSEAIAQMVGELAHLYDSKETEKQWMYRLYKAIDDSIHQNVKKPFQAKLSSVSDPDKWQKLSSFDYKAAQANDAND